MSEEQHLYELCDDGERVFLWKRCAVKDCKNFICIGASKTFCYPHTLEDLLKRQIEAINKLGNLAKPEVVEWIPRDSFWVGNMSRMESLLLGIANLEVNYVGESWRISALEILRRINEKD